MRRPVSYQAPQEDGKLVSTARRTKHAMTFDEDDDGNDEVS